MIQEKDLLYSYFYNKHIVQALIILIMIKSNIHASCYFFYPNTSLNI